MINKLLGFLGRCLLVFSNVDLGFNMLTNYSDYLPALSSVVSGLPIEEVILSQARAVISVTAILIVMASLLTVLRLSAGVKVLLFVELFHLAFFAQTYPAILRLCTVGALLLV